MCAAAFALCRHLGNYMTDHMEACFLSLYVTSWNAESCTSCVGMSHRVDSSKVALKADMEKGSICSTETAMNQWNQLGRDVVCSNKRSLTTVTVLNTIGGVVFLARDVLPRPVTFPTLYHSLPLRRLSNETLYFLL